MSILSLFLILFFIIDPLGNIGAFEEMLKEVPKDKRRGILLREMGFALVLMLFFYVVGDKLLELLELSEMTVRVTAGLILFLFAIKILFPKVENVRTQHYKKNEIPYFVPLSVPLVASPSLLATIMLFANIPVLETPLLFAIFFAWFAATLILLFSQPLYKLLGTSGLAACEKLTAMILVLLAIQRFLEGIKLLIAQI